jgi:hypothetical protein
MNRSRFPDLGIGIRISIRTRCVLLRQLKSLSGNTRHNGSGYITAGKIDGEVKYFLRLEMLGGSKDGFLLIGGGVL